jgi:hypothetical protein
MLMHKSAVYSVAIMLTATLAVRGAAADYLMLRATSVLPNSVGVVLFDIAQQQTHDVRPQEQVEPRVQANCGGSVSQQYIDEFVKVNGGTTAAPLLPAKVKRTMNFPPCPRISRVKTSVPLLPTDNLQSLLERELGATPDSVLLVCQPVGNLARLYPVIFKSPAKELLGTSSQSR